MLWYRCVCCWCDYCSTICVLVVSSTCIYVYKTDLLLIPLTCSCSYFLCNKIKAASRLVWQSNHSQNQNRGERYQRHIQTHKLTTMAKNYATKKQTTVYKMQHKKLDWAAQSPLKTGSWKIFFKQWKEHTLATRSLSVETFI